jgi:dsRNA-specific ribonuclease
VITTLIAVVGTLAGTVVAGVMQHISATRTARKATAEERRKALADAVPALLGALVRHREQQYLKIVARREGVADTAETRAPRYAARSAVTSAMDTLYMVAPSDHLLAVAQEAVDAAFALGDVSSGEVDVAGNRARHTHTALRIVAASYLYA